MDNSPESMLRILPKMQEPLSSEFSVFPEDMATLGPNQDMVLHRQKVFFGITNVGNKIRVVGDDGVKYVAEITAINKYTDVPSDPNEPNADLSIKLLGIDTWERK